VVTLSTGTDSGESSLTRKKVTFVPSPTYPEKSDLWSYLDNHNRIKVAFGKPLTRKNVTVNREKGDFRDS
jgi:hypothetical protein